MTAGDLESFASRRGHAKEMDVFYPCTWITYRQVVVICLWIFSITTHLSTRGKHLLLCFVPSSVACRKQLAHISNNFADDFSDALGFLWRNYWLSQDISSLLPRGNRSVFLDEESITLLILPQNMSILGISDQMCMDISAILHSKEYNGIIF